MPIGSGRSAVCRVEGRAFRRAKLIRSEVRLAANVSVEFHDPDRPTSKQTRQVANFAFRQVSHAICKAKGSRLAQRDPQGRREHRVGDADVRRDCQKVVTFIGGKPSLLRLFFKCSCSL